MSAFVDKQLFDRLFQAITIDGSGNVALRVINGAARQSAYTQTYGTADKTHANPTAATLADNTAGTANTTLEVITGVVYTSDVAAIRNNFADLAAQHNALLVDVLDAKQLINSVINDLRTLGLVG